MIVPDDVTWRRSRRGLRPLVAIAALYAGMASAIAGPAINQFEVKDLESGPGDFEFQSQNAFSTGQPSRRYFETSPGEYVYDDNTVIRQREALEIQLGITDWFRVRIGIEYEQERLDDPEVFNDAEKFGSLILEEVALEGVLVFVKPSPEGVGLGLLVEYGSPVSGGWESQSELYVGPIIEAHTGPWGLIANLAFVRFKGGQAEPGDTEFVRDEKWDFAYFVQGTYEFSKSWTLALEAYGTFDRLGNTGARSEASEIFGDFNQHRIGPIAYYTIFPGGRGTGDDIARKAAKLSEGGESDDKELSVTVGAGALFGLNENTPDTTYKLSVEIDY